MAVEPYCGPMVDTIERDVNPFLVSHRRRQFEIFHIYALTIVLILFYSEISALRINRKGRFVKLLREAVPFCSGSSNTYYDLLNTLQHIFIICQKKINEEAIMVY